MQAEHLHLAIHFLPFLSLFLPRSSPFVSIKTQKVKKKKKLYMKALAIRERCFNEAASRSLCYTK